MLQYNTTHLPNLNQVNINIYTSYNIQYATVQHHTPSQPKSGKYKQYWFQLQQGTNSILDLRSFATNLLTILFRLMQINILIIQFWHYKCKCSYVFQSFAFMDVVILAFYKSQRI